MAKYSLDISSEEHYDFDVFSITSTESVYRIIHELNGLLNIDLQLNTLLDFSHPNGDDFYFPVYVYFHDELNIEFNLLPNQTSYQPHQSMKHAVSDLFAGEVEQSVKLIPELENTDFFLLLKGDNRFMYNHTVLETIRKSNLLINVNEVFFETLKDKKVKGNLLF